MNVFVAGATGAIGTQLVPRLAAAGHDVIAMTRSPAKTDMLRALGAQAVGHGGEAVGVPHLPQARVALEGGELVDDHLGLG
ncbi:MAG TPA: NAD(P)H-binding protein, partial [Actinomycetes bacterium]|nr:NAD(P)H-binding protein [Actinomycetes bacterium]